MEICNGGAESKSHGKLHEVRSGTLLDGQVGFSTGHTLSRWSSEPASLNSAVSDETRCDELLERTSLAIVILQKELSSEKENCRRLMSLLDQERTRHRAAGFDAVVHCIEKEHAENRQLHVLIRHQKKLISKLKHRLRGLMTTDEGSYSNKDDVPDVDLSLDEKSSKLLHHSVKAVGSAKKESFKRHHRAQSDIINPAFTRQQNNQNNVDTDAHSLPASNADMNDENMVLSQRLRDTVVMCQKLVQTLDAKTEATRSNSRSLSPAAEHVQQTTEKVPSEVILPADQTCSQLEESYKQQLAVLEGRLKEVESMNERWQRYMEQRDKYTRAIEIRCTELEQERALNAKSRNKLSEEQQMYVDQVLLDQRLKLELAEEAKAKLENDVVQLKMKLKQQEMCVAKLVGELKDLEARRRTEKDIFEAQLTVYKDDFANEQHDRHRAQQRVVSLERQLACVMHRLQQFESSLSRPTMSAAPWPNCNFTGDNQLDGSMPLLVARGIGSLNINDTICYTDAAPKPH